jgi:hypothetical protein
LPVSSRISFCLLVFSWPCGEVYHPCGGGTTAAELQRTAERFNTENTEKGGRDPSTGLKQRCWPQDDDARRIVRKPEGTEKALLVRVRM